MSPTIRLTVVQLEIRWCQLEENLRHLENLLEKAGDADLIVLPEMFATGFIFDDLATMAGGDRVQQWMQDTARAHGAAVMGSVAVRENDRWYNRLLLVEPNGKVQQYDKRHLFVKSPEPIFFKRGEQPVVFEYQGWRICPQVCYDLRFPLWSRNTYADGRFRYDILVYVANWPAARSEHWNALLKARAIENQAYVVAANCVGHDPQNLAYVGDSQVLDFQGVSVQTAPPGQECLLSVMLTQESLQRYRQTFLVWQDWDHPVGL